jgi:hypothetical protein
VVFEVPDAVRALERLDYTTVWEEHTLYFTANTFRGCLQHAGFDVVSLKTFPYTLENSLVAIARAGAAKGERRSVPRGECERARRFLREFPNVRDRIRRQLDEFDRIAMLGAGHLTGAFLNLYDLADRVAFVVDDNPHKQGLFMPGSRLPILSSSALPENGIDLCLMTVRPEIEEQVALKNRRFVEMGGLLASVFPDSVYSLDRAAKAVGAAS